MKTMTKVMMMALLSGIAAGCASSFNGQNEALSIAEEHPISVDSQVVTLTIDNASVTDIDRARIKAFSYAYLNNGHGPITMTTPARNDTATSEKSAAIRDALSASGLDVNTISTVNYVPNAATSGDVILSYTHYVATPSACGVWSGLRERDYQNRRSPNFGCATRNNLAAMIGDPRELTVPADQTAPDAVLRIRGVEAFRAGEVTSSERDDLIQADTDQ